MTATLKCKWCGDKILKLIVPICNKCWHLFYDIENNLDLAKRMLVHIEHKKEKEDGTTDA